ncbi:hypothetical protein RN001_013675 [Aquatica leii]|uniref:Uncharacterized protein n=1 Tax=Aquatica leii TaxID=1421715 RepID=A0AAN7NWK7_9COLE|nr:hypothetical protein RN001_013675 [Aquatica leii]
MLKLILCVTLLLGVQASRYDIPDEWYTEEDFTCMYRTGFTKRGISDGFNINTLFLTHSDEYETFLECWQKEMKLMTQDGDIIVDEWKRFFTDTLFPFLNNFDPRRFELAETVVERQPTCFSLPDEYYTIEHYMCMALTGVSKNVIDNTFKLSGVEIEADENFGKFMECWQKEMHMMSQQGAILPTGWIEWITDTFLNYFDKEIDANRVIKSKEIVETCKYVTAANSIERAMKTWNCILPKLSTI